MATIEEISTCDEVIREVRRIKETLAREFDFDVHRILEDARRKQLNSNRVIVRAPARPNA